jgi:fermentation-respiration switch protein FrsA (DUF1100 family)
MTTHIDEEAASMNITRSDISIPLPDGVNLGAWLYTPDGDGRYPAITMAHGFGGTKYHGLDRIARRIAEAGFVVCLHDHRGFGDSGGVPRQDIDPYRQIEDWRRVIAHLQTLEVVDSERIGIWGSSYSGGHALVLGATDRRLRAVYAQVPTASGSESGRRRIPPHLVAEVEREFAADELAQAKGSSPATQRFVSADLGERASYRSADAIAFYLQDVPPGKWDNTVTIQSNRRARSYDPAHWIDQISPTPLLMVVAANDTVAPTDLALAAYERALQPKELLLVPGGHFDPYLSGFETTSGAAVAFFAQHLRGG